MSDTKEWLKIASIDTFPVDAGMAALAKGKQIAIFNFARKGKWYATDNVCPHKGEQCMARGLLGDSDGTPKVACPFHKRAFSLESGECLTDDIYSVSTYEVKVEDNFVYVLV